MRQPRSAKADKSPTEPSSLGGEPSREKPTADPAGEPAAANASPGAPPGAGLNRPQPRPALRRARSPFRWVRRALLLVGILGILALGVLLAAYQFGKQTTVTPEDGAGALPDDGSVTISDKVDFVQTSGGEQVFRVRADRSTQDREGNRRLEGVTLDVDREDGTTWTITSERATLTGDDAHAVLEGDVEISGWGDMQVKTRVLEVVDRGNVLRSPGTVEFRYPPDLVGRASRMRVDKLTNTVLLEGGVHVHSVPGAAVPLRLDCQRLMYRRSEGLIRAVEDVYLAHGGQELWAHYLSLFLREDQRTMRVVRARWDVRGKLATRDEAGGEIKASLKGQFLEIEPDQNEPEYRKLKLEGTVDDPVELFASMPDGLARKIQARQLEIRAHGGNLHRIKGFGDPLTMVEFLDLEPRYPLRHVCSDTFDASFQIGGDLDQMVLRGQVEVSDPTIHVSGGDQALVNTASGALSIRGAAVELYSGRGDITAPEIDYSRNTGLIKARGGVQASLTPESTAVLSGTPLAEGEGPVRVEAEEAHWTERPPGFVFKGGVRAWRGQNLLLADQMRGDEATEEMAAAGSVRSVWIPESTPEKGPQAPVEVQADNLALRGEENTLVYIGSVRVVQGRRTIDCDELTVELDEGGSTAERMLCRGNVKLVDPEAGNEASGDRALYLVSAERVEIFGNQVRLVDGEKNTFVGQYLLYDLASGDTRLSSKRPTPSPPPAR